MPLKAPNTTSSSILVVDDQAVFCEMLQSYLGRKGYEVTTCSNAKEALELTNEKFFDLVIADVNMPGQSGIDLLEQIKAQGKGEKVIIMTGFASISQGVESILRGASDYLTKPFQLSEVVQVVKRVLSERDEKFFSSATRSATASGTNNYKRSNYHKNGNGSQHSHSVKSRNGKNRFNPKDKNLSPRLIGNSPGIRQLYKLIEKVAPTDCNVLITGSTGTGKEIVARITHENSHRRSAPFIDINCSAIPDTLFEAELFGHERGTFTGAHETRPGLFERASGGTLFLDEIDTLDLAAQAKLLRVLQERHVRRVGGRENIPVDVRVISATNRDLSKAIKDGSFRLDLFFRLRVVPLYIPALCERKEDIPLLIEHFLQRYAEKCAGPKRSFSHCAMQILQNHSWPGNVRELENVIEYCLTISTNEIIEVDELPTDILNNIAQNSTIQHVGYSGGTLADMEREFIISTLKQFSGNQVKTAEALGIDRRTLYRKLHQYGFEVSELSNPGEAVLVATSPANLT
jgi:DNA-binding NtrC family response regulator